MKNFIILVISICFMSSFSYANEKNVTIHKKPIDLPQVNIYDINNNEIQPKDLKGQTTIISFWSKNCLPCIRDLKSLNTFSEIIKKDKGIKVIMLSPSTEWGYPSYSKEIINKFGGSNLTSYIDKNRKFAIKMGILTTPHMIIINKKGQEVARIRGGAKWDDKKVIDYIYNIIDKHTNKS